MVWVVGWPLIIGLLRQWLCPGPPQVAQTDRAIYVFCTGIGEQAMGLARLLDADQPSAGKIHLLGE